MKNVIIKILGSLANQIKKISSNIKDYNKPNIENLKVLGIKTNKKDGCLSIILSNNYLLTHKDVLESIFYTLKTNENFKKFGENKIIIVTGIYYDQEFTFHHNVLITNNTTFEVYYNSIKDSVQGIIDYSISSEFYVEAIPIF
jgi:hypothetical protein